jgi:hypothetical protein
VQLFLYGLFQRCPRRPACFVAAARPLVPASAVVALLEPRRHRRTNTYTPPVSRLKDGPLVREPQPSAYHPERCRAVGLAPTSGGAHKTHHTRDDATLVQQPPQVPRQSVENLFALLGCSRPSLCWPRLRLRLCDRHGFGAGFSTLFLPAPPWHRGRQPSKANNKLNSNKRAHRAGREKNRPPSDLRACIISSVAAAGGIPLAQARRCCQMSFVKYCARST